jgi:alkanesulfonate monooxygenase SsuD/methylene tetrahydromethanopterin reductase-like flavin-dependent oxidoreductase (luciferase family)
LITPLPRRRTHQLARETVTLDRLSAGRLVLGVGVGSDDTGEFAPDFLGEEPSMRERGRMLDAGLDKLAAYWGGEFEPLPVSGKIPVWVASNGLAPRPMRRAARWDGWFPIYLDGPASLTSGIASLGPVPDGFDVIVTNDVGVDPGPWFEAGATWCLTGFGKEPTEAAVRTEIDAGP